MSTTASTQLIVLTGADQTQITALPEALILRDQLLDKSRKGLRIASPDSCVRATNLMRDLKSFAKRVTDAHQVAKAPILEAGRKADAIKSELILEITSEASRIGRLIGDFESEQAKIRAAKIARQEAEARRIREDAEAKERKAREDAARAEREAKAAADKAAAEGNAVAKAMADKAAKEAREKGEREAAAAKANGEAQIAADRAATAIATKPSGASIRSDVDFEITDIAALYAANPQLVTLTVKRGELKDALKALAKDQSLPGVRHWETNTASVRTA